jgi:HEAT repeat protein
MRPRRLGLGELALLAALTFSSGICLGGCESAESRAIFVLRTTGSDNDARVAAIKQLQAGGKAVVLRANSELILALDSIAPDVQSAAEEALTPVGPEVASDLVKLGGDAHRRASVLRILRQTSADNAVVEQVLVGTKSNDYAERLHATELLGALAVKNDLALTQLRQLISDQDPLIRIAAIDEVTDLEPSRRATLVPALIGALDDPTMAVREAACVSLGSIGPSAIQSKSALERVTKGHDSRLAQLARIALANVNKPT